MEVVETLNAFATQFAGLFERPLAIGLSIIFAIWLIVYPIRKILHRIYKAITRRKTTLKEYK